jgi:hypothetical protein
MSGFKESIVDLKKNAGELIDNYVQLAKVQVAEKSSNVLSLFITLVIALALIIFFFFFVGIAASIWVGYLLDNTVAGYLIIGGLYLLLAILIILLRKKLILPVIAKSLINKIYGE